MTEVLARAARQGDTASRLHAVPDTIRVLVVDDHLSFGEALAERLRTEDGFDVVAAVPTAELARRALARHDADVALVDEDLAGDDGIILGSELLGLHPRLRLVILSADEDRPRVISALRSGASGWITKDCSFEHLLDLLRGVAGGETWVPPRLLTGVLATIAQPRQVTDEREQAFERLTPREREVLGCMAEGLDRSEIAARLFLSPNTVRTHTQKVLGKLGVHSSLAAVAAARRAGLANVTAARPRSAR